MQVGDVLTTAFDDARGRPLHSPIMVVALRGCSTSPRWPPMRVDELMNDRVAPVVASIDPDPFFDFTQERPLVEFDDTTNADALAHQRVPHRPQSRAGAHDLVLLAGVEPHLRYATFADASSRSPAAAAASVVVTVGAAAEAIPHTRPPHVVGSSTNDGLVRALGLSAARQYQGITGLVGVLQERLDRAGIPAVSLRVGVPHYLGNARSIRSRRWRCCSTSSTCSTCRPDTPACSTMSRAGGRCTTRPSRRPTRPRRT
jgi:hypothetical protein